MKEKLLAHKKGIVIAVVIALIAGTVYYKKSNAPNTDIGSMVSTTPIIKGDIQDSISLRAPLEGTESAEIVSRLHYEVLQLNVKEGDRVKKGQVLAVLDSDTLKKDIKRAEDQLALAKVESNEASSRSAQNVELAKAQLEDKLKDQQTAYEKAVLDRDEAKRKYDNLKTLVDAGVETEESLKEIKNTYESAQQIVDSYTVENGKVVATEADLKSIENSGDNSAGSRAKSIAMLQTELNNKRQDLEECQITSPIDGTITRVNIKLGRFADDTDDDKPMFVVENIDQLEMEILISEYDIGKIEIGQTATITADILKDEFVEGIVDRISPTGEEKAGSTERVIPTTVRITGDTKGLIAGINAKAEILIAESKDTLILPLECLQQNPDGTISVLRVNSENKIEVIPVTTGIENDLNVEIFSDMLQEGDNIVVSPTPDLTEGTAVTTPEMMQQMNQNDNEEDNTEKDEDIEGNTENNTDENTENNTNDNTDNAETDSVE
ncbi:MAG: efflux RND transporter periplasmic adaptor subunit [Firmicutes bacterium]|jgi:HlyD family secretion protein|nr:efflux RND transporter periplasmic adaptor subunit [Bacillota bacterium]